MSKILDNNGHGVIVFVEDIDQVTRGNRDTAMQDILNTLDGGDTKNMNVIAMFTTNHIELIEPTFLRGKRIGSIVSLGYLDANTAKEFLKYSFANTDYNLDSNLDDVCKYIEDNNIAPAFMAEIVESLKSKMIFSNNKNVTPAYVKASVDGYLKQVGLSKKKDMTKSDADNLFESFEKVSLSSRNKENIHTIVSEELTVRGFEKQS